jgi:hypothetical protein
VAGKTTPAKGKGKTMYKNCNGKVCTGNPPGFYTGTSKGKVNMRALTVVIGICAIALLIATIIR